MFIASFVERVNTLRKMFGASRAGSRQVSPQLSGVRQLAGAQLQHAAATASGAPVRGFFAGAPFSCAGYALAAITLGAAAMTALLPISSLGPELGRALRLSWWFS